jgi:hypothetical protein
MKIVTGALLTSDKYFEITTEMPNVENKVQIIKPKADGKNWVYSVPKSIKYKNAKGEIKDLIENLPNHLMANPQAYPNLRLLKVIEEDEIKGGLIVDPKEEPKEIKKKDKE